MADKHDTVVVFYKTYFGFEDAYDLDRDIAEMWEYAESESVKKIPGEYKGKLEVSIKYYPTLEEAIQNGYEALG